MSDYDKREWQAQQAAQDAALEKQRAKERKARERSARNAKRKLERLHRTLSEQGAITDFEDEFGESVTQRLEDFGSAFHDLQKGRPGDALSFAQKRVVAAMNKKVKDLKKSSTKHPQFTPSRTPSLAPSSTPSETSSSGPEFAPSFERREGFKKPKPRSSFKPKFTPRVRHLDDELMEEEPAKPQEVKAQENKTPFIPEYEAPKPKRPFLRLVN